MNKIEYEKITRDIKCVTQKVANHVYMARASIILEELEKQGFNINIDIKSIKKGRPKKQDV